MKRAVFAASSSFTMGCVLPLLCAFALPHLPPPEVPAEPQRVAERTDPLWLASRAGRSADPRPRETEGLASWGRHGQSDREPPDTARAPGRLVYVRGLFARPGFARSLFAQRVGVGYPLVSAYSPPVPVGYCVPAVGVYGHPCLPYRSPAVIRVGTGGSRVVGVGRR